LADLAPGLVDVVLARDVEAASLEQPGDGVAVGGPPAVADVDGSGRVGRDELDLDPLAMAQRRSGVPLLAPRDDDVEHVVEPGVVEVKVDESGSGDLDRADMGRRGG